MITRSDAKHLNVTVSPRDGLDMLVLNDVLMLGRGLKMPLELPKRNIEMSKMWIEAPGDGRRIWVPVHAIFRDHECPPLRRYPGMCLECKNGCGNNWKLIHPKDVVVLGSRAANGKMLFAWFVRFFRPEVGDADGNCLYRIPHGITHRLVHLMILDADLKESILIKEYMDHRMIFDDDDLWRQDFEQIATIRYERAAQIRTISSSFTGRIVKGSVVELEVENGPLHWSDEDELFKSTGEEDLCAVCLANDGTYKNSCCKICVCHECHDKCRGLCVVCDREKINGQYICLCCGGAFPLRSSGFPCAKCRSASVCMKCYRFFGECEICDSLVVVDMTYAI